MRPRYAASDHHADTLTHLNVLNTVRSERRSGKYWKDQSVDKVEITLCPEDMLDCFEATSAVTHFYEIAGFPSNFSNQN